MTLSELLARTHASLGEALSADRGDDAALAAPVTSIAYDSTRAAPGAVFVGLRGERVDGSTFAGDAERAGAVCIVSESATDQGTRLPWVQVRDARRALAALSVEFFEHPSHHLPVIAVTGTNGKTTTAYLIQSIFESAGVRCGRIGTIGHQIGSSHQPASLTTPEASDIQSMLRAMVDGGAGACVMEASSHALALHRVDQTRFATAVFTNLTRDHLDFHGDMNRYFEAKQRLFEMLPKGRPAIVNVDDPRGATLARTVERPVTYACRADADVTPGEIEASLTGQRFDVRTPRGGLQVRSELIGEGNTFNILAAVAAGVALDVPFSAIEAGVAAVEAVPGRFETVSGEADDVTVVVDFAHTDDALRMLLDAARPLALGRLITVFGCGGDRDRSKRPLMGAVAARLSDLVVVTSDNPRSEGPQAIIDEIVGGIEPRRDESGGVLAPVRPTGEPTPYLTFVDRGEAIDHAVREARGGDVVIVAGRGHERSQVMANGTVEFDDAEVARAALARRRSSSPVS
ncbi:MAG: UDP-N-acetylmuramoyl-L-alanyl-D-glutamate--2,6-diaminopimelate ligase [Vicinamibacterales bacterium]|jgi:UDP-N-acetylmuramoyl-L-alanyl-D-glutamate--2,6-diaminopimelate ligase|nr:UDP-N-acetylmuramoyl-L-alanyl-D-glutamate--2,6-diaminopimelate ligase [Acidobacteriota bacterium]MDP7471779.1 UDP-N-acetylmuramoyl-L-alanyl-D-glutamate--2,6-diaminopimelate ligase [Vicinamibacterales bacterium]MDP7671112.1 UDP-N-acetylmuramoyl-L-alanyl-D-glutamate--2,6-diaminopimelate ligase [Vicinamibacterales bacterium]HJO39902.1 UDP-N-acetylmuramoyl-L-alanyl-D-glutamate--2,6-diaminopimelate ligase [Vicinamibacterales bacterium]|tara:strand:+ start:1083 stop:2633 length:1551 start_codon:yes stop_codon:yes gene_type:complete